MDLSYIVFRSMAVLQTVLAAYVGSAIVAGLVLCFSLL